jgi:hypothetical protein
VIHCPRGLAMPMRLVRPAVDHRGPRVGAAEGVGAGVAGIRQDLQDGVVHGQAPRDSLAPARLSIERRTGPVSALMRRARP